MRTIPAEQIKDAVVRLILETQLVLPADIQRKLSQMHAEETCLPARAVLSDLLDNAAYAAQERLPLCQDTGMAVFFVQMGEDVRVEGGLKDALTAATREAYDKGFLRKSICDPLTRKNTGNNTPIALHFDMVQGDRLHIDFMPKGGGAENMSKISMLTPSGGLTAIKKFVMDSVRAAGPNPCPPILVGIGIGGSFDTVPALAKQALLRPLDEPNTDPQLAELENLWAKDIRALGIGAGGLGGNNGCLGVRIAKAPCHIASLPAAVNIQCNSARHGSLEI